jgi:hypothetical protein
MLSAIFDAGIFAIPPYYESEENVHSVIWRLIEWSEVFDAGEPLRLYKLSQTEAALALCACAPPEPNIVALFDLYNLHGVFSVNDVIRLYNTIMNRLRVLADDDLPEITSGEFQLNPDSSDHRVYPILSVQTKLAFANACTVWDGKLREGHYVVPGFTNDRESLVHVKGNAGGLDSSSVLEVPFAVEGTVPAISSIADINKLVDPHELWESCERPEEFCFAIAMGCVQIQTSAGAEATVKSIPQFSLGSEFVDSLTKHQCGPRQAYSRVVWAACCKAVLQPTILGPMGRPRQRVRTVDGAKAFRMHVTKRHEALRLMVWKSDSIFELANIGNKKALHISAAHGQTTQLRWT